VRLARAVLTFKTQFVMVSGGIGCRAAVLSTIETKYTSLRLFKNNYLQLLLQPAF
jgi:hypothetical protein